MPMARAEWKTWSVEKRQFYAELFTCYQIADGEPCIDATRRQQHVRQQLSRQASSKDAELVINSTTFVNYILVGDLLKDDKVKVPEDDVNVLYLQRTPLTTPSAGLPVQNTLVGGFCAAKQEIPDHFARVLKQKMSNDAGSTAKTIAERATCILLGVTDDLTVISRCALDKEERFLLEEPEFKAALEKQARDLLEAGKSTLSVEGLSEQIARHIIAYSDQTIEQASLPGLSVPSVKTYAAFYPERFSQIWTYVKDIETEKTESEREAWCYKPQFACLVNCLIEGPLKFAFQSEYAMLVKLALILKSLAGKSFDEMIANFQNPITKAKFEASALSEMFRTIAEAQIENISGLVLHPSPLFFIGSRWGFHRSTDFILDILKSMHYIDLYSIAQLVGSSHEAAHLAFCLESQDLLTELNQGVSLIWRKNKQALLEAIQQFLEQQCAKEKVLKPTGAHLECRAIPAASELPKGPGALSVFNHAVAQRASQVVNPEVDATKKPEGKTRIAPFG